MTPGLVTLNVGNCVLTRRNTKLEASSRQSGLREPEPKAEAKDRAHKATSAGLQGGVLIARPPVARAPQRERFFYPLADSANAVRIQSITRRAAGSRLR